MVMFIVYVTISICIIILYYYYYYTRLCQLYLNGWDYFLFIFTRLKHIMSCFYIKNNLKYVWVNRDSMLK